MNEELSCVYKATTKKGEVAHFGEYSSAKAWAGFGKVEQVPLKTLVVIEKSAKPCGTCEALARTVMLDQTSHDAQRTWVGLTDDDKTELAKAQHSWEDLCLAVEARLKERNHGT
jgi:hypothetical protein